MFEKLRNAFSSAAKSFGQKELKEKDIDEVLFELEVALLESDVATEVIEFFDEGKMLQAWRDFVVKVCFSMRILLIKNVYDNNNNTTSFILNID